MGGGGGGGGGSEGLQQLKPFPIAPSGAKCTEGAAVVAGQNDGIVNVHHEPPESAQRPQVMTSLATEFQQ